ncbi:hypothetical protein GCM10027300_10580 [Modestobacter lapidis]
MRKPFPPEFRRDVIAVARKGEASISQVARDFGISEFCLQRWLRIADRDDGLAPPAAGDRGTGEKTDFAEFGSGHSAAGTSSRCRTAIRWTISSSGTARRSAATRL